MDSMVPGDYVKVLGEADGVVNDWYGEVVGVLDTGVEVYFIERESNGVWRYSDEWHCISKESVNECISTGTHGVVKALELLGFRPLDESTFVKLDEEASLCNIPIGMPLPAPDDFVGIHPEMSDFIVDDECGEAFSFASPSDFVRETHEAVHGFNNWNPVDTSGKKVKDFVNSMSARVTGEENSRTQLGCALSYDKPPLYK